MLQRAITNAGYVVTRLSKLWNTKERYTEKTPANGIRGFYSSFANMPGNAQMNAAKVILTIEGETMTRNLDTAKEVARRYNDIIRLRAVMEAIRLAAETETFLTVEFPSLQLPLSEKLVTLSESRGKLIALLGSEITAHNLRLKELGFENA